MARAAHRVTTSENGITNGIEIFRTAGGATRVMASNNDCVLRSLDPEALKTHHVSPCLLSAPGNGTSSTSSATAIHSFASALMQPAPLLLVEADAP